MEQTLNVNPETVCFIIARAREFQAKDEVVIPDEPADANGDWALDILEDHRDDMTLQEVQSAVADLEPDQQYELVALMWVGRGDYDVDDWDSAVLAATEAWTERTADYLMTTPMAADYLEEGLELLGYSCEE
ncbi:MAG: DUF3775 domain-containing protein [Gammaproteobacteria bacterium]